MFPPDVNSEKKIIIIVQGRKKASGSYEIVVQFGLLDIEILFTDIMTFLLIVLHNA